jgi:O-succinylbenzoic acid--CoA ligase
MVHYILTPAINGIFLHSVKAIFTMSNIPKTLTFNGQNYSNEELFSLADSLSTASKTEWERSLGQFLLQWLNEKAFIEVMTSGSTGSPKLIQLNKKAMIASANMTGNYLGLHEDQTALLCLRAEYIAGIMMVVRAMVHRMNLIVVEPSGSPLDSVSDNLKIDFAAMVPAQIYNALGSGESKQKLEAIGTLIIGGGPMSGEPEKMVANLKGRIYATFGMTETITHIALRRLNGPHRSDTFTLLPGITIETDERGCLVAAVPYIDGGKVTTNDLVNIVSPTTFRWLGRADHVINCGGVKIIPEQAERRITGLITHRFFIAPLPDDKMGEIPVLVIETLPMSEKEIVSLLNELKSILSKDEIPRRILQTERFVTTENGKINRKESVLNALNK